MNDPVEIARVDAEQQRFGRRHYELREYRYEVHENYRKTGEVLDLVELVSVTDAVYGVSIVGGMTPADAMTIGRGLQLWAARRGASLPAGDVVELAAKTQTEKNR